MNKQIGRRAAELPPPVKQDPVNSPAHYTTGGIETIDFMQAKLGPEGFEGYLVGNVIKYIARYRHKNGLEDLRKARWYLDRLIREAESGDLGSREHDAT